MGCFMMSIRMLASQVMPKSLLVCFLSLMLVVAGCARDLSSDTYQDQNVSGVVLEGQVVSMRAVKVQSTDQLGKKSDTGTIGGGIAGAIAGSAIGGGRGAALAMIGGAIAGGALGSSVQNKLSKIDAIEYIVKVKGKNPNSNPSKDSNLLSVILDNKQIYQTHQKVYVIFSGDRIRLTPMNV